MTHRKHVNFIFFLGKAFWKFPLPAFISLSLQKILKKSVKMRNKLEIEFNDSSYGVYRPNETITSKVNLQNYIFKLTNYFLVSVKLNAEKSIKNVKGE